MDMSSLSVMACKIQAFKGCSWPLNIHRTSKNWGGGGGEANAEYFSKTIYITH